MWRNLLPWFSALLLAGCMLSEQRGDAASELTFDFDTPVNRYILYGRSAGLAILALGVFKAERGTYKKVLSAVVGLPAVVAAGYLYYRDYPDFQNYRIALLRSGLYISVPPEPEIQVDWQAIERLEVKGVDVGRGIPNLDPTSPRKNYVELPDWHQMTLTLASREKIEVDLSRLSVEQRQTRWQVIARHAQLVEEK